MVIGRKLTILALLALSTTFICVSKAQAQRGGFNQSPFDVLRNASVRKELDITADQQKQLEEARTESRSGMRKMFEGMRDLSREERRKKFTELREKINENTQEALGKILLKPQQDRLKQLTMQIQMQRRGTTNSLSGQLAEELNITEEQKKKIKEVSEKAQKELNEKIAKLRKDAQEEILGVLTSVQKAKLKELTGDSFEYKTERRQRGQRQRGQGQRQRGQRQRGGQNNNNSPDA